MAGTIFTCVDCFLSVLSYDLILLASASDRELLANLSNLKTQNEPSTQVIVAQQASSLDKLERVVEKELLLLVLS
jgi:hypothetical protein